MEKTNIASINFTPIQGSAKMRAHISMPVWIRRGNDNKIHISLALLNIDTCVDQESEIDIALQEAVEGFFHASINFGKGIKEELSLLGWSSRKNSIRFNLSNRDRRPEPRSYKLNPEKPAFAQMLKTGSPKSILVEV